MVFALETFWPASDGWSAARIEEQLVVTENGAEVITRFPAEELLVAGLGGDVGQHPGGRRLDLHRRLVGLNLHQRLALGDRLALPLQPGEEPACLLVHAQGGHQDVSRQRCAVRAAAARRRRD